MEMEREDEERFREWLDLDQADQDIGLPLLTTPPLHHYEAFSNETSLFSYPSSIDSPTIQPFSQLHLAPTTLTELNLKRSLAAPTYALDPALISASIPPPHTGSSNDTNYTPIETTHHHSDLARFCLPRRSVSSQLPLKREDGVDPHDGGDDDHDDEGGQEAGDRSFEADSRMSRNNHSRSSSAILFAAPTSSQNHKRTLSHSHPLINVPDWQDKPSAEEYKMLSSKEKRQLRNKISARNFRHRRKQHISTLEQQLAQRDEAIESLSKDLGQVRSENKELKSQIEVLKQKWSDLIKKIEEMSLNSSIHPSIAPLPSTTITTSTGCPSSSTFLNPASPRSRSAKTNGMIPLPNLHKDLGSHTRKPFNGVGGMTGGGNVGVHTTLIPEVTVDVYEEPFLIGSNDLLRSYPMSPHTDLSPQALIELQLNQENNHAGTRNGVLKKGFGASLGVGRPISAQANKTQQTDFSPAMDVNCESCGAQGDEKNLRERLMNMVFETLKKDSIEPSDASNSMDVDKLQACLEGRLVFKLVELSPPPYRPLPPFNDFKTTLVTTAPTHSSDTSSFAQSSQDIAGLSSRLSEFQI